jgi:serine/threonine-protein kinase
MVSPPPESRPEPERSFGRYRVLKTLGAGAMGEVFLARDELLARDVAVKTLRPLALEPEAAEAFRARFLNEARAVAALAHPHVVRVFDLGFEDDAPYLVMELVGGSSLRERQTGGRRLSFEEIRMLGIQLARALEAAHARGIVHRDVKPANVLEADPGTWKLADFGVAHVPDSSLTVVGQFIGSPAYAAPEALLAGEFSPATDVYGVGATLYEALVGRTPYGAPREVSLPALARRSDPDLVPLRGPEVPADLARAIETALARDPAARPSAAQLATALAGGTDPSLTAPAPALPAPVAAVAAPAAALAASLAAPAAATVASLKAGWLAALRGTGRSRWVLGALASAVILGVAAVLAASGGDDERDPPAASVFETSRGGRSSDPWPQPFARERSREQQKRWQKARQRLDDGRLDEAAKELEKLLARDPDDEEARHLLEQIAQYEGGRWRED